MVVISEHLKHLGLQPIDYQYIEVYCEAFGNACIRISTCNLGCDAVLSIGSTTSFLPPQTCAEPHSSCGMARIAKTDAACDR